MSNFWIYFTFGLKHLWNFKAYTDVLFLLVLTVPYEFKAWKKILILVSLFIAGHTLALMLSVFNVVAIKTASIALIIPILILIAAIVNLISAGKSGKKDNITFVAIVSSLFGILHGLGFASYFNTVASGKPTDKLLPLFESALGFGIALIIAVTAALLLAYVVQTLLKFSKRDWILIVSAFVAGVVTPMILHNKF